MSPESISPDAMVIRALCERGSDPSKPHHVDFFFVGVDESSLRQLASSLAGMGMKVVVHAPDGEQPRWTCTAWQWRTLDLEGMEEATDRLTDLANSVGAEYDGWGAEVVS